MNEYPRILTNMVFWQSDVWRTHTDSIYRMDEKNRDTSFMPLWQEARALYKRRNEYDIILTMGIRESMAYAALCALTGRPSKQVMTEVFIDEAQPHRLAWRVKTALYGYLARRVLGIITNSSSEIETTARRFDLPVDSLRFIPLCATIEPEATKEAEPPYIFSAGRTLRDYTLILRAAESMDNPFVIVCGASDLTDVELPAHVRLFREISREAYLDWLRGAAIVALPLRHTERSTGQVVMLEAMAMEKPVITTRSPGTRDYIRDEANGFLIDVGDGRSLIDTCQTLLASPERRRAVGACAQNDVRSRYTHNHYAESALAVIRDFHTSNEATR